MEDKKTNYLASLKVDYHIFNEIDSILNDNLSNHVKLNLISDVIKQEVNKILDDVYEEGYCWGQEDEKTNSDSQAEVDYLRECLRSIQYIMSDVEF